MISWLLSSSLLALAAVLLRLALRERLKPRLRAFVWGLLLLRLLIPASLFTAPQSMAAPAAAFSENLYELIPAAAEPSPAMPADGGGVPLKTVLVYVWLSGVGATTLWFCASNLALLRRLRLHRERLDVDGEIPVYTVPGLPSPCVFGVLRPAIYLAPELASDELTLDHVLAHERAHIANHDNLFSFFRSLALALHWFNPLIWWAASLQRRDAELAADALAVKRLGEGSRAAYARTLMELTLRMSHAVSPLQCATTMTGGKSKLAERIRSLSSTRKTPWPLAAAALLLAVTATLCAFTSIPKPEPKVEDKGFRSTYSRLISIGLSPEEARAKMDEFASRGYIIAEGFGIDTTGWICAVSSDISQYMGTLELLDMRHALKLKYGDTGAIYFLSPDGNTLLAAKQDIYMLNYLFTFALGSDGYWILQGEPQTMPGEEAFIKW